MATIYKTNLEQNGISQLKDFLDENCISGPHKIASEYNVQTTFLGILQIKSNIPTAWKNTRKKCTQKNNNIPTGNILNLNNRQTTMEKTM